MIANLHALAEHAFVPDLPPVEGHWQAIQLRPDFASSELLNIGVFFTDGRRSVVRLLNELDRFTHIYGEAAEDELRLILGAIRASVAHQNQAPTLGCLELTVPKLARGVSPEEIASRLFASVVTLEGKAHVPQKKRAAFLNNTQVRERVFQHLRVQAGLFADELIAQHEALIFAEKGSERVLDVPLRYGHCFGSVVSGVFAKVENVERALLRAFVDLATAKAISSSTDVSLFLLRPEDHQTGTEYAKRVDAVLTSAAWKFCKMGIRMDVANSEEELASDILSWARRRVDELVCGRTALPTL